jgi:hygromycin-B 4-O-kinase
MGGVCRIVPLPEGEDSQSFAFHHGESDYVVRVNKSADGFKKDLFACESFTKPELPIPEIIHIRPLEEYAICISRRACGVTLQDLDAAALPQIVGPTARVLNEVSGSNVDRITGFGVFDSSGIGREKSWRSFLVSIGDPGRYDWALASRSVDMRLVHRLIELVDQFAEHCPEERKLVHGDFGSNNVLANAGKITAVIDWSEALVGDPLYDVANTFFWRPWLRCMELQARYFENLIADEARWRERMLCYQLRIGLDEIYENAVEGHAGNVDWTLSRCLQIANGG